MFSSENKFYDRKESSLTKYQKYCKKKLKVLYQVYNFITKRITRTKIFCKKIPIGVKLVKLIFCLCFPKDIFKVFINLQ